MEQNSYSVQDWKGRIVKTIECASPVDAIIQFKDLGYDFSKTRDEMFQFVSSEPISQDAMSFLLEEAEEIKNGRLNAFFGSNRYVTSISDNRLLYHTHGLEHFLFENAYDFAKWHFDEDVNVKFQYSVRLGERNNDGEITWRDDIINPWEIQMDPEEDGSTVWSKPMPAVITDNYNKVVDAARFKHHRAYICFGRNMDITQTVAFEHQSELDAYIQGLNDMNGWLRVEDITNDPENPLEVTFLFGSDQDLSKKIIFPTKGEMQAYYKGINDSDGWEMFSVDIPAATEGDRVILNDGSAGLVKAVHKKDIDSLLYYTIEREDGEIVKNHTESDFYQENGLSVVASYKLFEDDSNSQEIAQIKHSR